MTNKKDCKKVKHGKKVAKIQHEVYNNSNGGIKLPK